jgi:hypothetical protein
VQKGKVLPVTGCGCPKGSETLRLPHFLCNLFTDGGEVDSLKCRPPFTARKIPGTHFCLRLSRPHGHSVVGRIKSIEKSSDLIGNKTRDLPACSIVPQTTTLLRVPVITSVFCIYVRFAMSTKHLTCFILCMNVTIDRV